MFILMELSSLSPPQLLWGLLDQLERLELLVLKVQLDTPGSGSGTIISSTSYTADNTMGPVDGYSLVSIIMGSSPPTIQLADANASSTRPAIGAVQSISGGVAYLQSEGELPGFSGLIVGHQYYLSDSIPGTFTINAPTAVGSIVQKIGFAKTSTIFVLEIDADFTLL